MDFMALKNVSCVSSSAVWGSWQRLSYVPSLLFALNLCEVFDAAVEDVFSKEEHS